MTNRNETDRKDLETERDDRLAAEIEAKRIHNDPNVRDAERRTERDRTLADVERKTTQNDRSAAEIEHDAGRVRSRMDDTIDELSERLRPKNLISDVVDAFLGSMTGDNTKETAKNVARRIGVLIKDHPMPALLIGSGIAWSLLSSNDEDDEYYYVDDPELYADPYYGEVEEFESGVSVPEPSHYPESVEDDESQSMTGKVKGKVGSAASSARGAGASAGRGIGSAASSAASSVGHAGAKAGGAIGSAGSRAGGRIGSAASSASRSMGRATRRGYRRAGRGLRGAGRGVSGQYHHAEDIVREQYHHAGDMLGRATREAPLGVGLGLLGVGVLAGLLIPTTRKEDDWMGEQSDAVTDSMKEAGSKVVDRGRKVASQAASKAMEEAQRQGLTPDGLRQKAAEMGDAVVEVAKSASDEAKKAANEENLTPKGAMKETKEATKNPDNPLGKSSPSSGTM